MKTMLTVAILGLTGLAGVAGAEAQDVRTYRRDGPRHESRYESHRQPASWWQFWRHRTPRVERVWVPARYESRFAGTDHCGRPIYRSVCVSEGYWTTRHCD
jgi:hypothetical protein